MVTDEVNIRKLFQDSSLSKEKVIKIMENSINILSKFIRNIHYEIKDEGELGLKGIVTKDNDLLLVIRYSPTVTELYLKVFNDEVKTLLDPLGFNDLSNVMSKWKVRGLPTCIVISKVIPSKSLYLLMCGDESNHTFPNIKVMIREENYDASSSYCRVSDYEDICSVLNTLITYCSKLHKEFFT